MSTVPTNLPGASADCVVSYPTSDGRPMGETDLHREIMFELIETLKDFFRGQQVYVSGNILLYYEQGNQRRRLSPDVLVTKGLEMLLREYYLLWEERLPPNVVIEVTSASTRREDLRDKMKIYREIIKVNEYFLFDPRSEYLKPALQGYRLQQDEYVRIESASGRLPSQEMGLHLERAGQHLRLYDPRTGRWVPTPAESRQQSEEARQQVEKRYADSEAEIQRLRAELEALQKKRDGKS